MFKFIKSIFFVKDFPINADAYYAHRHSSMFTVKILTVNDNSIIGLHYPFEPKSEQFNTDIETFKQTFEPCATPQIERPIEVDHLYRNVDGEVIVKVVKLENNIIVHFCDYSDLTTHNPQIKIVTRAFFNHHYFPI